MIITFIGSLMISRGPITTRSFYDHPGSDLRRLPLHV